MPADRLLASRVLENRRLSFDAPRFSAVIYRPHLRRTPRRQLVRHGEDHEPRASSISCAAATTGPARRSPGCSPRRELGPLAHTAALKTPPAPKTGALTLATPASRSATLSAHPRPRTSASSAVFMLDRRSASSAHARSTFPPEPRSRGSTAPTGTISLKPPPARANEATHTRRSP